MGILHFFGGYTHTFGYFLAEQSHTLPAQLRSLALGLSGYFDGITFGLDERNVLAYLLSNRSGDLLGWERKY